MNSNPRSKIPEKPLRMSLPITVWCSLADAQTSVCLIPADNITAPRQESSPASGDTPLFLYAGVTWDSILNPPNQSPSLRKESNEREILILRESDDSELYPHSHTCDAGPAGNLSDKAQGYPKCMDRERACSDYAALCIL